MQVPKGLPRKNLLLSQALQTSWKPKQLIKKILTFAEISKKLKSQLIIAWIQVLVHQQLRNHLIDSGVILESKKVNYKRYTTYNELRFVINKISAELLIKNSIHLLNNKSSNNIVNNTKGNMYKQMNYSDKFRIRINFLLNKKYD